jgi:hypothetical protein
MWRCEQELPARSIYRLLHAERDWLFPDELFADLYIHHGRCSVPPPILAVVMVLQRLEGCSDRETCDRFCYDLRWRYAAGVDDDQPGFVHTVLVELRARLRASRDPDRVFQITTELARQAGLVGVRRVLDSAPLYDAVATQDTVTLLRGALRGLLRACPAELASLVRAALARDDDYQQAGKPVCDWEDPQAREQLVDALFRDGYRALYALRGRQLGPEVAQAAELLATVIGQDIEETADGRFVIARGWPRGLTATRGMWPSTPTARSSPRRKWARPTPRMRRWLRRCWPTCPKPPAARSRRRPKPWWTRPPPSRYRWSTAMPPMGPARCWRTWRSVALPR